MIQNKVLKISGMNQGCGFHFSLMQKNRDLDHFMSWIHSEHRHDEALYETLINDWETHRRFVRPQVDTFDPYYSNYRAEIVEEPRRLWLERNDHSYEPVSLGGSNIQVIVKMANIHLTPSNPEYPGGSWHVEGEYEEVHSHQ